MAGAGSEMLLKVLCIHGYRQNGQIFRERTGAFRKIIKKHAELVFITAPNVVPPLSDGHNGDEQTTDQRGWWFSRPNDYFNAHDASTCLKGYEQSLEVIKKAFLEQGPFDGVLGFSQGASLLSLLCGIQQQQGEECPFHFDFAIFIAGFKSRSEGHSYLYDEIIQIPTLHVYGETDKVIEKAMSEELLQCFNEPRVLVHPGGHFIPASAPQKKVYMEYLDEMKRRKNSQRTHSPSSPGS